MSEDNIKLNQYSGQSSHSVGYSWKLSVPEGITEDEINYICDGLLGWSDDLEDYEKKHLADFLHFEIEDNPYTKLDESKIDLYQEIKVGVKIVHREFHFECLEFEESVMYSDKDFNLGEHDSGESEGVKA